MDNKQQMLEEYRRQLEELNRKINALSQEPVQAEPLPQPTEPAPPVRRESIPVYYAPHYVPTAGASIPNQQPPATPNRSREGVMGRNLFAILASVLILAGVCIFISSIYEYIPMGVKVLAIYLLGGVMLGGGLALYRRKKNRFWLGVASCGLAELLVCIFACYTYFEILPLAATFVLCLLWVLASIWLTKIQPETFKIIGYIGFLLSVNLGHTQIYGHDPLLFTVLLSSFVFFSLYFMSTTPQCTKTNATISFLSVLNLSFFFDVYDYLPEHMQWLSLVLMVVILGMFHGVYVLHRFYPNAYPYLALITFDLLAVLCGKFSGMLTIPLLLGVIFILWHICIRLNCKTIHRCVYSGFSVLSLLALVGFAFSTETLVWLWFIPAILGAYWLYHQTKRRDIPWLGLACFVQMFISANMTGQYNWLSSVFFVAALGFFLLTGSRFLRYDGTLQCGWYLVLLLISDTLHTQLGDLLMSFGGDSYNIDCLVSGFYLLLLTVINTGYLHILLQRKTAKEMTPNLVIVLILQGILLFTGLSMVSVRYLPGAVLGIASSLLAISYSPYYLITNKLATNEMLIWQFIKYSVYIITVVSSLSVPSIISNIFLLVVAVLAIIVGIRMDHKSVRTYGLVVSLIDVCHLVLFQVEYTDSLQFSLGVILCGVLCFVISYVYSRFAKAAEDEENQ